MKKVIKILVLILTFAILFQNTTVFANVVQIGETKYIERGSQGDYTLMYYDSNWNEWFYIVYSQTYYTDDNGNRRIAYCNTPDLDGVGWLPNEYSGYDTTIQRKLSNDSETDTKLWRVFKNGYPYSSLNVECDDDAYLATKQAAYFIIKNRSEDEVYSYFKPSEQNEWLYMRGKKIIDEIYRLVSNANHSTEEINRVTINKVGEIVNSKTEDGKSYQEYEIVSNSQNEKIEILDIINCPQGTTITDIDANEKKEFSGGEHFRLNFVNSKIDKDYNIEIKYKSLCNNYPVFFSKSSIEDTQDYLLSVEKYDDEYDSIYLDIDSNKCNLEILKKDENTSNPIPGVTFDIQYKKGEKIGTYTTDEKGMIRIENLRPEEIIITEVNTPLNYIIDNSPKEIKLYYNATILVEISNKEIIPEIKEEQPKLIENKTLPRTGY